MSYYVRGATKAEQEMLERAGFFKSPFESLSIGETFHGPWHHREYPNEIFGPGEALELMAKRQQSFQSKPDGVGHTSSDFQGQRGASLFEVLIFLFIFIVLAGILFGGCSELTGVPQDARRENAQVLARNWVREFRRDIQNPSVSCMGVDTDRNGYVTCQVGSGAQTPLQIECRYCWLICVGIGPSDCREYRVFTPQFVNQQ